MAEKLTFEYDLILHASSAESLAEVQASLAALGGKQVSILPADFSDPEAQEVFCKALRTQFGDNLYAVVNNAGLCLDKPILYQPTAKIDLMLNVNLRAAILVGKTALKIFVKRGGGVIINIGSVVGEMGHAYQSVYSATKAAMSGLSRSWAQEAAALAPGAQIRALTVNPGFFLTDMTARIPEAMLEPYRQRIANGTFGQPAQLADFVAFLLSDKAAYLNGVELSINGGMH